MTVEAIRDAAGSKSGIDLSYVDSGARPQDDLFGHVNGRWLTDYEMPADRATDGAFRSLYDRAEEQVRDLITGAATAATATSGRPPPKAPTSSASATCTPASWTRKRWPRRGLAPLRTSWPPSTPRTRRRARRGASALCSAPAWAAAPATTSTPTPRTPAATWCTCSQSGIGLPDESYYREEQHAEILAAYPKHIAAMFALVPAATAERSRRNRGAHRRVGDQAGGRALGRGQASRRGADLQPAHVRRAADGGSGFDWAGWVTRWAPRRTRRRRSGGAPAGLPHRFRRAVVGRGSWRTGRTGPRWRLILRARPMLTDDLVAENFAFYGRTLIGRRGRSATGGSAASRWSRA